MPEKVGMPSVSGVRNSMIDFAVGLGGGLVYSLSASFLGSGLIGGLVGAGIAGSVIKGQRGSTIATVLGFQSIVGAAQSAQAAPASSEPEVM